MFSWWTSQDIITQLGIGMGVALIIFSITGLIWNALRPFFIKGGMKFIILKYGAVGLLLFAGYAFLSAAIVMDGNAAIEIATALLFYWAGAIVVGWKKE